MKQYIAFTEQGTATIIATNLHQAWEQAYATYAEVRDVQFVGAL